MDVVLSPHNDDETLFMAYTCLRYRPLVIVCLRSYVEATWPGGPHYETREAETARATAILGCEYQQWGFPDSGPDWRTVAAALSAIDAERVWAPLYEEDGHRHHNEISRLAADIFPQVKYYATYTYGQGKSTIGEKVEPEEGWEEIKREAMSCYASQAGHPNTHLPFDTWAIDEYLS